jgi:hypothetical protein
MTKTTGLTRTEFSPDMVATLAKHFERYHVDGIVTLETNQLGVWIVEQPNENKVFLGLARPNKKPSQSNNRTQH